MIQQFMARRFVTVFLIAAISTISPWSRALTILSGPSFTPAANAPLAGLLQLTTDVNSRVSVLVSDGTDLWERDFYDYATTHSVPLLGFKPGQTNQILVTVYDKNRNAYTVPQPLTFVTTPLSTNFPLYTVLTSEPGAMEPGYTLFLIQSGSAHYITIMDNSGEVVWYSPAPATGDSDVRQMDNGDLFIEEDLPVNDFLEVNLL